MPDTDDPARLAGDLATALDDYAAMFREAVRIAADGISVPELAEWARACWETALDFRLIEVDEVAYAAGAPASIDALVRELYESAVIFSGVERVAHILSLPLSTCANGETLAGPLAPEGEIVTWCCKVMGAPFVPPEIPRSLIRDERDDSLPLSFNYPEGAADADRIEAADSLGPVDLGDTFAVRLDEGIAAYRETVGVARTVPADAHAIAAVHVPVEETARRFAPSLLGLARIAAHDDTDLYAPDEAPAVARLVSDGLVTLAAAETGEDFSTLPYPDPDAVDAAAAPLHTWFSDHGVE